MYIVKLMCIRNEFAIKKKKGGGEENTLTILCIIITMLP